MKARCTNQKHKAYHNYGGRGIQVDPTWLNSMENFWNDMNATYQTGLDLDRVDNDGNYTKNNCRWATRSQNCQNKRNSLHVPTELGLMPSKAILDIYGIKRSTLHYRIKHKWPENQLLIPANSTNRVSSTLLTADQTIDSL